MPTITNILCGATRPGHFTGVTTIVAKLLNITQPDSAVFGIKDFQQLTVVRRMVEDLCMSVQIIEAPVARADDGLALSSRNSYLTEDERKVAPRLYQILQDARAKIQEGNHFYSLLEEQAKVALLEAGLHPDYFSICCQKTLEPASSDDRELVILAAAYLGQTRLIDNVTASIG